MLNSLQSQPMHPPSGIHFRNPFRESTRQQTHHIDNFDIPSPSSGYNNKFSLPLQRPLTPPPDMNTVAPNVQHSQYHYHGDRSAATVKYGAGPSKYDAGAFNQHEQSHAYSNPQSKLEVASQSISRPRSPVFTQNPNSGASRRESQVTSIALALQIPRSVNNSQGSLAELAAQITCLFWFESSTTLERAESPSTFNHTLQSLVPDAIPTTGFRKWVTTILSTTQVAQNVIILALLFIYRLKKLNPAVKGKSGSEYRLLTVALMLGNKFLDDNTYTNKTWAEVSGISVAEVHIMEVEFLSNMKYALFTSAEEWAEWQTQLGRFASFFEDASRVPVASAIGINMPSPPTSNHASPPYSGAHLSRTPHGPTPNLSPMGRVPDLQAQPSRKRSLDSHSIEPPAKRQATASSNYGQTLPAGSVATYNQNQFLPRVPLPSLAIPHNQQSSHNTPVVQQQQQQFVPQLPPLNNYPQRSFGASQTPVAAYTPNAPMASSAHYSSTPIQLNPLPQSITQSRHQSPYPGSANVSPSNGALQPAGQVHSSQLSPSYYLEQRNSPYRPIRGVNTLLVPPPSRATQQPQHVGRDQMHYQPLGRPQDRQTGQLPYIAQNQWFGDAQHQNSASAYQWPSFMPNHQHQHTQLPLPTPSFGRV